MDPLPTHNPMKVIDHVAVPFAEPGYVNIWFASRGSGFALTFEIRSSHMLRDVKASFASCTDKQPGGLVYTFKGQVVEDAQTPEQLRMVNGDMVEVAAVGDGDFIASCTEGQRRMLAGQGFQCVSTMNVGDSLVVKLRCANGYTQPYRVKPTTRWSRIVKDFRKQIDDPDPRFIFEGNQVHGRGKFTIADAERDFGDGDTIDGAVIDVFREQERGGNAVV